MCGISGIISTSRQAIDSHLIKKMNDLVVHRGPNDEGFFFGDNFALGHRRFSIIDLTKNGHQPMTYLGKNTISYNGEIYNYLELKDELNKNKVTTSSSKTDTEVILAAYDKWGQELRSSFQRNVGFCHLR